MLSNVKNKLARIPENKAIIVDIFKILLRKYGSFEEKILFAEKMNDFDLTMNFGSKDSFQ